MQEPDPAQPAAKIDLEGSLHELSQRLREADRLGPEAQRSLADLLDELARTLHPAAPPSEEAAHLAASSAHLAATLKQRRDRGAIAAAIRRLEEAATRAEMEAPVAAGFARQLLEVLANLGI